MATVKKTTSKTKPWQVRWRDSGDVQRKKSFGKRVDADRFRAKIEHTLNTGAYVDVSAGRQTYREFAERWRLAQPVQPNTRQRHESNLRLHAYPTIGSRPIAAITTTELQALATSLGAHLTPSSIRTVWMTIRAPFRAAYLDRVIGWDPARGVKLAEVVEEEVWPLTVEQVETLAELIDPRHRALVPVGAGLGPRQGEILGLQVPDIDFLRRREVKIERQVQPGDGGVVFSPPKGGKKRTVPAADSVLRELTAHLEQHRHPDTNLVFCTPVGKPWVRARFNEEIWLPARELAAAEFRRLSRAERDRDAAEELARRAAQLESCGMHDLRHFFASALIRKGLSVKAVANRLGHAKPEITLRVYSHLWPDDDDRTRAAIDSVFGHGQDGNVPQTRPVVVADS